MMENPDIQRQACSAIALLCGCNSIKHLTLGAGVLNRLLELAQLDSPRLAWPALSAVRYIAENDRCMRERIDKEEWLPFLRYLLNQDYPKHLKEEVVGSKTEACWIVAIIVRGDMHNIQAAIDLGLVHRMVDMSYSGNSLLAEAAVCAISSAISGATRFQIRYIVKIGCLEVLCAHLPGDYNHGHISINCLRGIDGILIAGEVDRTKKYFNQIDYETWLAIMDLGRECMRDFVAEKAKELVDYVLPWHRCLEEVEDEEIELEEEEIEGSLDDKENQGQFKKQKVTHGNSKIGWFRKEDMSFVKQSFVKHRV